MERLAVLGDVGLRQLAFGFFSHAVASRSHPESMQSRSFASSTGTLGCQSIPSACSASRAASSTAAIMLSGSATPSPGDVEGGAVIDRGADDRQAQRHVHRLAEREQLDRNQPLIVIAGDDDVELAAARRAGTRCRRETGPTRRCRAPGTRRWPARSRVSSSSPNSPCSPACGLSPATAMRGRAMPNRGSSRAVSAMVASSDAAVSAAAPRRAAMCTVASTTRSASE